MTAYAMPRLLRHYKMKAVREVPHIYDVLKRRELLTNELLWALDMLDAREEQERHRGMFVWAERWLDRNRNPALFLDSPLLVEFLLSCKYTRILDGLSLRRNTLKYYIPPHMTVGSQKLDAFWMGVWDEPSAQRSCIAAANELYDCLGLTNWHEPEYSGPEEGEDIVIFGYIRTSDDQILTMTMDMDHIDSVINGSWVHKGALGCRESEKNRDEVSRLIRIGLAAEVYAQAFPEAVFDGPPRSSQNEVKHYKGGSRHITFTKKIRAEHCSPRTHWRRGHFRVLANERYKKNDDGSPRIIFVRDAIVGMQAEPKTEVSIDDVPG